MTIVSERAADAKRNHSREPWRQLIGIRGDSLRLLEKVSNLPAARRDPESNTVILRGRGAWFPPISGASWTAICGEAHPSDAKLSDLTPVLRILLDATTVPNSDGPQAELAAWLHERSR